MLEGITLKMGDGSMRDLHADGLFIFIGAKPHTDWLQNTVLRDERGFVITGRDLTTREPFKKMWSIERDPLSLETSCSGIFAAGDVRSGAMNRIASAVGEGAMAVSHVHQYLAEK
jgi:thioredoxin reductase (NADPH)